MEIITLRTKKMERKYKKAQKEREGADFCPLCNAEPLESFKHWKIVDNNFPYDKITIKHHMFVPLRHVLEKELNAEETIELTEIKEEFFHNNKGKHDYNYMMEAAQRNKSVPNHFHLHLVVLK